MKNKNIMSKQSINTTNRSSVSLKNIVYAAKLLLQNDFFEL